MSNKQKNLFRSILFTGIGLLAGYLYYVFIGCNTNCAISSYPIRSSLYGGLTGLIASLIFWSSNKEQEEIDAK